MRKLLITIAFAFLLLSCRIAYRNPEYMEVFRADAIGSVIPTEYLVLKYPSSTNYLNTFDHYNVNGGGRGGIWRINGDTIKLYFRYSYYNYDELSIKSFPPLEGKDTIEIPVYLRKGDELHDITDHDAILGFHNPGMIIRIFKKMSQQ